MVTYTCAARQLCGMNNPQVTANHPQHRCANCRIAICGSFCGELLSECHGPSGDCYIPIDNLSAEGESLYNSHSALICKLFIKSCSVPTTKLPAEVTPHSSNNVSFPAYHDLYTSSLTFYMYLFIYYNSPLHPQHPSLLNAPFTPTLPRKVPLVLKTLC